MKRLILAGLVALAAFASVQVAPANAHPGHVDCSLVRCMACPEGYHFAPTHTDCCRCLPD